MTFEEVEALRCVVERPEVDVQRVEAHGLAGGAGEMPFVRACRWRRKDLCVCAVHSQGAQGGKLGGMGDVDLIQCWDGSVYDADGESATLTPVEGVLVWRARIIGDLQSGLPLARIVIEIEI